MFKSKWFYFVVVVHFLFVAFGDARSYGQLYFIEYIGIMLGSFLNIFLLSSVFWCICVGLSKVKKKVTKA